MARGGAELVRKMRVISHSRVCDGIQSPAEPGGVLSPEGLLPTPPPSDQQSRGQRHIRAQSCRAQAHLAGWHGQGGAGVQGSSGSTCGGLVPTCVCSQLRSLPCRRLTPLPLPGSWSVPDLGQSALPRCAFSEEALEPRLP